jgi:hypothetical protein
MSKALGVLQQLRNNPQVSTSSKRLLKAVETAVRYKDIYTTKMVMRYDANQPSLFGLDSDINDMLRISFANVTTRATSPQNNSLMAMFELK